MSAVLRAMLARCAVAIAACALCTSTAHAQWSAEVSVEQFDWREHTTPIAIHEHGLRYLGGARFLQRKDRGLLFGARAGGLAANVEYNGSFQFDATKAAKGASNYLGTSFGAEARWRWPGTVDALAGIDLDIWTRQLSNTQQEDYRVASLRLGVEHVASDASRISGGLGMRILVSAHEGATIQENRVNYDLALKPGLGTHPYLHAGLRVMPHVTARGYWDGMSLGESNRVVFLKRGKPQAVVSQPATDVSRVGIGVAYGW